MWHDLGKRSLSDGMFSNDHFTVYKCLVMPDFCFSLSLDPLVLGVIYTDVLLDVLSLDASTIQKTYTAGVNEHKGGDHKAHSGHVAPPNTR